MRRAASGVVLAAVLAMLAVAGCGPRAGSGPASSESASKPTLLRVSAATSLRSPLEEIGARFEAERGVRLVFNFGPSGQLQKQIEGGAPADAFLSASPRQIDALVAGGHLSVEETVTFAGNDLAIFVGKGDPKGIAGPRDLAKAERLVTGDPDTAPHGTKSKEWLERLGIWASLEPKFVFAENTAQTMDYVERGEVDAGIGFESDAIGNDAIELAYLVPAGEIEPIRYVASPLLEAEQPALAAEFVEFLLTDESQWTLVEAGFNKGPAK